MGDGVSSDGVGYCRACIYLQDIYSILNIPVFIAGNLRGASRHGFFVVG